MIKYTCQPVIISLLVFDCITCIDYIIPIIVAFEFWLRWDYKCHYKNWLWNQLYWLYNPIELGYTNLSDSAIICKSLHFCGSGIGDLS